MKILVAGGSGLVGRCLIRLLQEHKIDYVATYNSRPILNGAKVNFEDESAVTTFLEQTKPTVCVNCIVQRQTDVCEKNWDETKRTNIDIVDILSRTCAKLKIRFVHISTDYIFDGRSPPYTIHSKPNPLQNYGISKLIAEQRVTANCHDYGIIRVPVLYCDTIENLEENAVTLIGKKVLNQIQPTQEDDYSIRRPVYIPDFCNFILSYCLNPKTGTFHFYNTTGAYTKYEIAKRIGAYLEKPTTHISPSDSTVNVASRPRDTRLIDSQYSINDYPNLPLEEGIARCFSKLKHPSKFGPDCLLLLDLDGTLLDTDRIQYEAYRLAFQERGIEFSWADFDRAINHSTWTEYFDRNGFTPDEVQQIRTRKVQHMKTLTDIQPIPGAVAFIKEVQANGANLVVVTNTSREVVEHYKEHAPFLKAIQNWVCKEDYGQPKPSPDCFHLAIQKYSKGERYCIGFENTLHGFEALRQVTPCIYFITDTANSAYPKMKKEDVYLIRDFNHFLRSDI